MALSSLSPSNMLGELGRLASWLKGDCLQPEEYGGLAVTEKVGDFCLLISKELDNSI